MNKISKLAAIACGIGLAMGTTTVAATDVSIQGNSILRAYSSYCDPAYYDAHKLNDGQWDEDMAQSYARVLLVRHAGNCNSFFTDTVSAVDAIPHLQDAVPELRRDGGGTLSEVQLLALGGQQWFTEITIGTTCSPEIDASAKKYSDAASSSWLQVGANDTMSIASGYNAISRLMQAMFGPTSTWDARITCLVADPGSGMVQNALIRAGMISAADMEAEIRQSNRESNERFEQAGHEHQKQGLIERLGLREGNPVKALTMLTGWWWYQESGDGCDDTDNQYRLALGSWHWDDSGEIVFGKGPFAIGMYEGGCTLSDLRVESDAIVFHGECEQEQEPYSGEGRISITSLETINLQLPGATDEGIILRACPVSEHVDILSSPQF